MRPCQPFSKQNRQKKTDDRRVSLLDELRRFIRRFKPEYLFVENVPGMQRDCDVDGPFAGFIAFLKTVGYSTRHDVVQSLQYGVPQYRQRLLLAATRMGSLELPPSTHGPGTSNPNYPTVWQAIGGYPALAAGEEHPTVPNHRACALSPLNLARIRATPEGGSRKDWPSNLLLDCHKDYDGHSDVYGRLHRDRPRRRVDHKVHQPIERQVWTSYARPGAQHPGGRRRPDVRRLPSCSKAA